MFVLFQILNSLCFYSCLGFFMYFVRSLVLSLCMYFVCVCVLYVCTALFVISLFSSVMYVLIYFGLSRSLYLGGFLRSLSPYFFLSLCS